MLKKAISIDISNLPRSKYYGSRRLHAAESNSDYDIYVHASEIDVFALRSNGHLIDVKNYLSSTAKYGTILLAVRLPIVDGGLPLKTTADILIFSDKRDIEIMNDVLNNLSAYSLMDRRLLKVKEMRIALFNEGLQRAGFTQDNSKTTSMREEAAVLWDLIEKRKNSTTPNLNPL